MRKTTVVRSALWSLAVAACSGSLEAQPGAAGASGGPGGCVADEPCYPGNASTAGKGICAWGHVVCDDGGAQCVGYVLPQPKEVCPNAIDDDCNGFPEDGCPCMPGDKHPCGSGLGACSGAVETCPADGQWQGKCDNPNLPAAKDLCGNAIDDDCNGLSDDGCENCKPEICGNGIDEDCNGKPDDGCTMCTQEICGNGIDEDCNGKDDPCCEPCTGCNVTTNCGVQCGCVSGAKCNDSTKQCECPVLTQTRAPGKYSNTDTGMIPWEQPEGAVSDNDGINAKAYLSPGETTKRLTLFDFGFTIPADALVLGAQLSVNRFKQPVTAGQLKDEGVRLWLYGAPSESDDKKLTQSWSTDENDWVNYGNYLDQWGNKFPFNPGNINAVGFGAILRAGNYANNPIWAKVDAVTLTIAYIPNCDKSVVAQ
jgi:hypothetical protein